MNKLTLLLSLLGVLQILACPTCVNNISSSEKPFFNQELDTQSTSTGAL